LKERVCVITGASRGIGLATALRFARAGARLVLAARDPQAIEAARREVERAGAACEAVAADVATRAGAESLVAAARRRFGGLDVLVNNAGAAPRAPLDELTDEQFELALAANVRSVFYATRAAWRPLRERGGGVVVSVSSLASDDPFPGFAVYGACKAWVNLFTRAIAAEGRPLGIRAFAVAPGAVETGMLRGLFPDFPAPQALAPDDVAGVIESVCAAGMAHASGQTIFVRK